MAQRYLGGGDVPYRDILLIIYDLLRVVSTASCVNLDKLIDLQPVIHCPGVFHKHRGLFYLEACAVPERVWCAGKVFDQQQVRAVYEMSLVCQVVPYLWT